LISRKSKANLSKTKETVIDFDPSVTFTYEHKRSSKEGTPSI